MVLSRGGFVLSQQLYGMIGMRLDLLTGGNSGSWESCLTRRGKMVEGGGADLGDSRPHNLQVQTNGETVAFVLFCLGAFSHR